MAGMVKRFCNWHFQPQALHPRLHKWFRSSSSDPNPIQGSDSTGQANPKSAVTVHRVIGLWVPIHVVIRAKEQCPLHICNSVLTNMGCNFQGPTQHSGFVGLLACRLFSIVNGSANISSRRRPLQSATACQQIVLEEQSSWKQYAPCPLWGGGQTQTGWCSSGSTVSDPRSPGLLHTCSFLFRH